MTSPVFRLPLSWLKPEPRRDRPGQARAADPKEWPRAGLFFACAVAAIFALQTTLILTHRPWADEFQAVLIAVQAPDLPTMFAWLRYEGHPGLWYLLLRGLDVLAPSRETLTIAALGCAAVTQAVILFRSPFARSTKLLIAASVFVLFEFMTVSRGTTLGVTLVLLLLAMWQRRNASWLLLALLPQVDFLFGVLSGIFLLFKWRERSLWWPGVALWLASSLAAAWSVLPAPDMVSAFEMTPMESSALGWFYKISGVALPLQGGIRPQWNTPIGPLGSVLWIAFIALCRAQTRHDRMHLLAMFGFLGLTFVFSTVLYPMGLRHLMIAALLLIALAWRDAEAGRDPTGWFVAWLASSVVCTGIVLLMLMQKPFDSADNALAEIERRDLGGAHWMAYPDWRVPALAARSGIQFERIERHCMMGLVRWDLRSAIHEPALLQRYLEGEIERHGRSYLVSDRDLGGVSPDVLKPLAEIAAGYNGVPYFLYEVGPEAPLQNVHLPPCVAGARPLDPLGIA